VKKKIEIILNNLHKHFLDEEKHYSEFESSDIEYFVGCMLYNHFAFSKALDNLKTMDLSYDFLSAFSDEEFKEIEQMVHSIAFEDELQKLEFLQNYIEESREKYTKPELYLLDRLFYHVNAMAQRYEKNADVVHIDFQNPLLRK
jgi:enoyl-[acyl-carrier-protein] reductase (NADH)